MPITWPDSLVREIAEHRCIIFMGAGVSMGSVGADGVTRPPGWEKFLKNSLSLITDERSRRFAAQLIKKQQFLDAAEVITEGSDHAAFGNYLRETFDAPRFVASEMHKLVLDIDPKIVITTNYDQIYDRYCTSGIAAGGYNVTLHTDNNIVDSIRSRVRLVVKAHGCVSRPQEIILSRSSYYKARRDHGKFYSVLDALFLTNTILFIGCSLTDPDIQLVLENVNLSAPSAHPHYALVEKSRHQIIKSAIKTTHNIELLEYPAKQHAVAVTELSSLRDRVVSLR